MEQTHQSIESMHYGRQELHNYVKKSHGHGPACPPSFHVLDYLLQYGLYLAEVITVVIAIGVVIGNAIRHMWTAPIGKWFLPR